MWHSLLASTLKVNKTTKIGAWARLRTRIRFSSDSEQYNYSRWGFTAKIFNTSRVHGLARVARPHYLAKKTILGWKKHARLRYTIHRCAGKTMKPFNWETLALCFLREAAKKIFFLVASLAVTQWHNMGRKKVTEFPKIYSKSVLHLLKYRFAVYLSKCSTDLR